MSSLARLCLITQQNEKKTELFISGIATRQTSKFLSERNVKN
jgi:hypothetical protein